MLSRGHFTALEFDDLLRDSRRAIVDVHHLRTCRACREGLLDLAVMAGIARGADFPDPLEAQRDSDPMTDPSRVETRSLPAMRMPDMDLLEMAFSASTPPEAPVLARRSLPEPLHLSRADMDGLLASAFAERADHRRLLPHLRHLTGCDPCLGRFLRRSARSAPSPQLVEDIVAKLKGRGDPDAGADPDTGIDPSDD